MAKKKQIVYPVLFMIAITVIYTAVLAFINESSSDIIAKQEALRVKRSILYVVDLPVSEIDAEVESAFNENINEKSFNDKTYYEYGDANGLKGYAFKFSGTGLWGTITGYIAFDSDFTKILGIDFISHSETPGLGGRIEESWFKEQFRGISLSETQTIVLKPADGGNIDGITGATLTTDSVRKMVNTFVTETLSFAKEANL
ncbi:MAG: hypothetical protein BGO41_05400 [Clostridiales bacterium 38-18]|nr:MAG: hypothetical protein BGO41_05400 [Clostridiales bacterium 38-18]